MARTKHQLEKAAAEAAAWLDTLDPEELASGATVPADLIAVMRALEAVAAAEQALEATVLAARQNGRSWGRIGIALGVSRQAALQRFGPMESGSAPEGESPRIERSPRAPRPRSAARGH